MPTKQKKKSYRKKGSPIKILLIPIVILGLYMLLYNGFTSYQQISDEGKEEIPPEFIPIYKAAEKEYGVPWNLLAAHHRVETRFSQMDTMISPVGAEGHLQFMPCTFVGWSHPTCSGLGKGNISDEEKTNPETIKKYGGYGVDANGDGVADPWDIEDAIFSAAYYLSLNGAADGDIERAVFAYNHSDEYVEDVLYFAEKYLEQTEKSSSM
jgi:peptidoglycan LD-endopeptidase LytH